MQLKRRTSARLVGLLEPESGQRSEVSRLHELLQAKHFSRLCRRTGMISRTSAGFAVFVMSVAGPSPDNDRVMSPPARATVEAVFDGDTVEFEGGVIVDLADLDAPELAECHGRLSAWILRRTLPVGSVARVKLDQQATTTVGRGRPLAFIFRHGSINYLLVANGAANADFDHRGLGQGGLRLLRARKRREPPGGRHGELAQPPPTLTKGSNCNVVALTGHCAIATSHTQASAFPLVAVSET
jgi:endonuclease YncB( thermonuclease family)